MRSQWEINNTLRLFKKKYSICHRTVEHANGREWEWEIPTALSPQPLEVSWIRWEETEREITQCAYVPKLTKLTAS